MTQPLAVVGDNQFASGGNANESIITNNGVNYVLANGGDDNIEGGEDADYLFGGVGDDYIDGDGGIDYISGNDGNDILLGGAGNDQIIGSAGNDVIFGGEGDDTLTGNGGADIFALESVTGSDFIFDFELGIDSLGLTDSLTFTNLSIMASGSNADIFDQLDNLLVTINNIDPISVNNSANFINNLQLV